MQYNGNISAAKWSINQGFGPVKEMAYNYGYDAMNRLLSATHKQATTIGTWATGQYDEKGLSYDLNGNTLTLQRNGDGGLQIDNLKYDYGTGTTLSNKLLYVQDLTSIAADKAKGFTDGNAGTTTDYSYDVNGNMTRDLNKGIGATISDGTNLITYNYLNLPETITKSGNSVRYIYDAAGRKLSQVTTFGTIQKQTDYAGEYVYEDDVLQFINHEEGRIITTDSKLICKDAGESISTMIASNATINPYTGTNGEKYIRVTSTGTVARTGVIVGKPFQVLAGERYLIRAKGYRTGTNPVYLSIKAGIDHFSTASLAIA